MAGSVSDWVEVNALVKHLYPDRLPHEAYAQFVDDVLIQYPGEVAKITGPIVGPIVHVAGEIAEILALVPGSWQYLAAIKALRLSARGCQSLYRYLLESSQSMGYRPDGDLDAIAGQMTVEILKKITSTTTAVANSTAPLTETLVASASVPGQSVGVGSGSGSSSSIVNHTENIQASHTIRNTVVNHVRTHGPQVVQAAQMAQVIQELNYIATELRDGNCLTASGGSGPDGYGRHVYDLIQSKFRDIALADRRNHRVFVFHRDTIWYPAFDRLASENPLPPEYCMKRKNLDILCQDMQRYRQQLIEELDYGRDIVFHVLIPSWYKLCIREPLHFPTDLYPLQIEGELYHGEMVVEMNLPAAPPGLLHDVKNVLDPGNWDTIAAGAALVTTMPAVGWGANGACLALGLGIGALTGLGAIAAVPVWIATAPKAMSKTSSVVGPAVYNALREKAPRILGSNQSLDREAMGL